MVQEHGHSRFGHCFQVALLAILLGGLVGCIVIGLGCVAVVSGVETKYVQCALGDDYICPVLFVGVLGILPCIIVLKEKATFRSAKDSAMHSTPIVRGYVRPSLVQKYQAEPTNSFVAQRILLVAHFLSCVCSNSWDFLIGLVLIQLFVNSLYAPAIIVILTSVSSCWVSPWFVRLLKRLNRLSSMLSLICIERICVGGCILFMIHLFYLLLGPPPGSKSEMSLLLSSGNASLDSLKPWFVDSKQPSPGLISFIHRKTSPSWSGTMDLALIWIVFLCICSSVAHHARVRLTQNEWVSIVAKSASVPSTGYNASPALSGYGIHLSGGTGGSRERVHSLGALSLSDDEDDFRPMGKSPNLFKGYGTINTPAMTVEENLFEEAAGLNRDGDQHVTQYAQTQLRNIQNGSASFKGKLRKVQSIACFLVPILLGFVLDFAQTHFGGGVAALTALLFWLVVSSILEIVCYRMVYTILPKIKDQGPVYDSSVYFNDPHGVYNVYSHIGVTGTSRFRTTARWIVKTCRVYFKSPVLFASISYSLLSATILDCGLVSLAYLRWCGLPGWFVGVLFAMKQFTYGIVSFTKYIHKCTGSLAKTTSLIVWVLWCVTLFCILGFILLKAPSSLVFLLLAIVITTPFIRTVALLHLKLVREWVEEEDMSATLQGDINMKLLSVVLLHIIVLFYETPGDYSVLVLSSGGFCFSGVVIFSIWYRLYDGGTPFQVVNDIGELKLIVRG
mmetsp:Transcript_20587/g.33516  ORF Transcript_20587/g.33516 Transcript_20587/m.33516 type:complete len:731 (-) Transcript_20587:691-2883(-)